MAKIHKAALVSTNDLQGGNDLRFKIEVDVCPDAGARAALVQSIKGLSGVRDFVFPSNGQASLVLRVELQRSGRVKQVCEEVITILSGQDCFTEPPTLPRPLF